MMRLGGLERNRSRSHLKKMRQNLIMAVSSFKGVVRRCTLLSAYFADKGSAESLNKMAD